MSVYNCVKAANPEMKWIEMTYLPKADSICET